MRRIVAAAGVLLAGFAAFGANPPSGRASDATVEVSAVFLNAAAVLQATGRDFSKGFTVIEVTVTPRGGKPLDVEPDDFLLRLNSDTDNSGPMVAAQVLGEGGGLVLHRAEENVIGVTGTNPANVGLTAGKPDPSVSADEVRALQNKMLPAKTTSSAVSGLLFFPLPKKKPKDLDLVYSTPAGKLHISFR